MIKISAPLRPYSILGIGEHLDGERSYDGI
jgi:hypothetical protein